MTDYEICKKNLIHKIMSEYSSGKLKSSSGNKVKSKQQAIAIGLTMSNSKCQHLYSKKDKEKLKKKVDKFLDKDKISYSGILDVKRYIKMLNGKTKTVYKYKLLKFILNISTKQTLPKKITDEILSVFEI